MSSTAANRFLFCWPFFFRIPAPRITRERTQVEWSRCVMYGLVHRTRTRHTHKINHLSNESFRSTWHIMAIWCHHVHHDIWESHCDRGMSFTSQRYPSYFSAHHTHKSCNYVAQRILFIFIFLSSSFGRARALPHLLVLFIRTRIHFSSLSHVATENCPPPHRTHTTDYDLHIVRSRSTN